MNISDSDIWIVLNISIPVYLFIKSLCVNCRHNKTKHIGPISNMNIGELNISVVFNSYSLTYLLN
jgi:hypothetical protein